VHTLLHFSNINTDPPSSSISVKLEKQQVQNLRIPHRNIPEDQHPERRFLTSRVSSDMGTWNFIVIVVREKNVRKE
jgi:hypothetical protein